MSRLPTPGGDDGTWGSVLNDFLRQSHNADGTLINGVVASNALADNSITPTKMSTSGSAPVDTQLLSYHAGSQLFRWTSPVYGYVDINAQTSTTYTPALTDIGKLVTLNNASAIAVTLVADTVTAFPIGAQIDFVVLGAGMATFGAGTGAVVNSTPTLTTRTQYSAVSAIKYAANAWLVVGDLG